MAHAVKAAARKPIRENQAREVAGGKGEREEGREKREGGKDGGGRKMTNDQ